MITTSISQPEGSPEKHLVVSVQPGPRYTRLRLAFSGQQHVSAGRLEEVARSVASPWVDPAPLVQAITTMYRNEGFLDAGVSVSPPRFDGDAATLPIVIREGPQFRLASVTFVGARAHTAAPRRRFPLKPGAAVDSRRRGRGRPGAGQARIGPTGSIRARHVDEPGDAGHGARGARR